MGIGKNGTFDIHPDWCQWAVLTIYDEVLVNESNEEEILSKAILPKFILSYFSFFKCKTIDYFLLPIEGHGLWDKKECFGKLPNKSDYNEKMAVLTRATIRIRRLKRFWAHVDDVAKEMKQADGFITSIGVGEIPLIKNGTFSLWESKGHIKRFAYKMQSHSNVVAKTRKENWYQEEMFVRFKPLLIKGL